MAPLRIARPMRRNGVHYLRKRIPADVLPLVRALPRDRLPKGVHPAGGEVVRSLRTADAREAKSRQAEAMAEVERWFSALRAGPRRLTHEEVIRLSGATYRRFVAAFGADPDAPFTAAARSRPGSFPDAPDAGELWRFVSTADHPDALASPAGVRILDGLRGAALAELREAGIEADNDGLERLVTASRRALAEAGHTLARRADSDYGPDATAERFGTAVFPGELAATPAAKGAAKGPTVAGAYDAWLAENGTKARNTKRVYRTASGAFSRFMREHRGRDVALTEVTTADARAWRSALFAAGKVGEATIRNRLRDAATVVGFVLGEDTPNPLALAAKKLGKAKRTGRNEGITNRQAGVILTAASTFKPLGRNPHLDAAKRWVPWLCAHTGARVGEMAQLRREDVRRDPGGGDFHILRITAAGGEGDGRRLKNAAADRDVPIHPQLIALGFLDFVRGARGGALFYDAARPRKADAAHPPHAQVGAELCIWTKGLFPKGEAPKQPNHGWRHRFITTARHPGADGRIMDTERRRALTGHAQAGVDGAVYGGMPGLHEAVCNLPWLDPAALASQPADHLADPPSEGELGDEA